MFVSHAIKEAEPDLFPIRPTRAFERAADELRAAALLEPVPDSSDVDWSDTGPIETIRAFNDTIHYVLPKLLLIATAWDEGVWGVGEGERAEIPLGVAEGTDKAPMVSGNDAAERVQALLEREKIAHGHPLVSSYYRVLGNWPDFLEAAWLRVEPVVGSATYRDRMDALVELATAAVSTLPLHGELRSVECTEQIRDLLRAFRTEFIPSMMIDAGLIKAMIDGEEAARRSRFSAVAASP